MALRERVTIQSRAITVTNGQQFETFSTVGEWWANVEPVRATERAAGGIDFYTDVYKFVFRRAAETAAINPDYRLQWNGKNYDVKSSPNLADKKWIEVVGELTVPRA